MPSPYCPIPTVLLHLHQTCVQHYSARSSLSEPTASLVSSLLLMPLFSVASSDVPCYFYLFFLPLFLSWNNRAAISLAHESRELSKDKAKRFLRLWTDITRPWGMDGKYIFRLFFVFLHRPKFIYLFTRFYFFETEGFLSIFISVQCVIELLQASQNGYFILFF